MEHSLRTHAEHIVKSAISAVQPDAAVARALAGEQFPGRVILVAAGKAAWQMAKAAHDCLGDRIETGIVVTKYGHVMGPIADKASRKTASVIFGVLSAVSFVGFAFFCRSC